MLSSYLRAVGLLLIGCLAGCGTPDAPPVSESPAPASAPTSLAEAYAGDFLIGAALGRKQITTPTDGERQLMEREFNAFTPENDMKWEKIHPERDRYDWTVADAYVDLAEELDGYVVGHALVWYLQLAPYVKTITDSTELADHMVEHITTVVSRYRGRIDAWDVVNEALEEDGSIRESHLAKVLGPDYLALAFRTAAAADPDVTLIYNDYNLYRPDKRAGAVRLVRSLQKQGVKIDAVGMQGHYQLDKPTLAAVDTTIRTLAALGVEVHISELDLSVLVNPFDLEGADASQNFKQFEGDESMDPFRAGLTDSVQRAFDDRYVGLFRVFADNADKIKRVTFWGTHDGHSWLNNWPIRGRTNYPLLFDRAYRRKPVYERLLERGDERK